MRSDPLKNTSRNTRRYIGLYNKIIVLRSSGKDPDSEIPMNSYRKSHFVCKNQMFEKENLRSPDPLKNRGWSLDKNPTVWTLLMQTPVLLSLTRGLD